jgi:ELWxxDGT repeat protein
MLAIVLLAQFALSGSAQTVRRITSDNGTPIRWPSYLTAHNGQLYFRANNLPNGNNVELWAFNGTSARQVAEINPTTNGSDPSYLTSFNGRLYFCASSTGSGNQLWQYDPTTGATLAPGSVSAASLPQELVVYRNQLLFRAARFGAPGNIGIELWKFDGTNQTPFDLFPGSGSSYPQHFIEYNGLLYFNACGTTNQGTELWRYDGTNITEAARIYPNNGSSPENFAIYDGRLYFSAYDGTHGRELWRFDGTNATLAADIQTGATYASSNPNGLTVYNGKLYFSADDGIHGFELWSFDGTNAQMVTEINPTPNPGDGDTFLMDSSPANLTVFDGLLYFTAIDGMHGRELWSYDGDTARLVLDINPGPYGSEVSEMILFNGDLYLNGDEGYNPAMGVPDQKVFALSLAPLQPTLRLATPRWSPTEGVALTLNSANAIPLTADQLSRIQIFTTTDLRQPVAQWQALTNPLTLNGSLVETRSLTLTNAPGRFFRAVLNQ